MTKLADTMIDHEELLSYARQSMSKPEDFGYWGSDDMFESWGFAGIDVTPGSGIAERSNFRSFHDNIVRIYPDDFRVENYSHWAVGSIDRTVVRVLKDPDNGLDVDNITEAFIETCETLEALMSYPILDESDYSDLEYTEIMQDIEENAPEMVAQDEFDWSGRIYEAMVDAGVEICPDAEAYPSHQDIKEAAYHLGFLSKDHKHEWVEFCDKEGLSIPDIFRKNGIQIEGQQVLEVE